MALLIFEIFSFLFPISVNRVKRDIVECTSPVPTWSGFLYLAESL